MMNRTIDLHADDYGYSINTSKEILNLLIEKKLNSISVMANLKDLEESEKMFLNSISNFDTLPLMSVHINLVEGTSLSGSYEAMSWGKLLLSSFLPQRNRLKEKIKKEIQLQIEIVNNFWIKCVEEAEKHGVKVIQNGIRIDSHVHTHPVPIVWNSLMEVIEEERYNVEFIRNPIEPLAPFLKNREFWSTYKLINVVKNRILTLLSGKIDRYCDKNGIPKMYLWGLMTSGYMDIERVEKILPDMIEKCESNKRNLELLFHPGHALESEYSNEKNPSFFQEFNHSNNRKIEYYCLNILKDKVKEND